MRYLAACALIFSSVATGQELPRNTDEIKTLNVEQAEALARRKDDLSLNGLTVLSPEVARALELYEGNLSLNGLATLSDEAARSLRGCASLSLDGLTTMSPALAQALARPLRDLSLNGLTALSDDAAQALGEDGGCLRLNGLTSLSHKVATSLALAQGLELNGLRTLSPAVATAFLDYKGSLSLNGLATLAQPEQLQNCRSVSLLGLTDENVAKQVRWLKTFRLPAKFRPPEQTKDDALKQVNRQPAASQAYDHPVRTLVRPKDGVRHPDLDKAWAAYGAVASKAKNAIHAAITKQFDAAADKGDLDAAEKWQKALERFEKSGEFPIESDPKKAVRKPLAMEDNAAVAECRKANDELGQATDELAKAYESVVKALTIEKKLVEAKAARDEGLALGNAKEILSPQEPGTGLTGEYFRQNNFEGRSFRKIDSVFDRDYVRNPVGDGFPTQNFSIRWTGTIVPDRTDEYTFCGYCDDGLTILIDGKPVYENMGWAANFASNPVRLEAGKSYKVVFAYVDWGKGNAQLTLKWRGKGKNPEPIPVQCLFSSAVRP